MKKQNTDDSFKELRQQNSFKGLVQDCFHYCCSSRNDKPSKMDQSLHEGDDPHSSDYNSLQSSKKKNSCSEILPTSDLVVSSGTPSERNQPTITSLQDKSYERQERVESQSSGYASLHSLSQEEASHENSYSEMLSSRSKRIRKYKPAKSAYSRRPWTTQEDYQLLQLIKKYGRSWSKIAKEMGTRSGKQIRDRYLNKLDPQIVNAPWSEEEDEILMAEYHNQGKKWSKIATKIPGRSETMVKNRFYSKLQSRIDYSHKEKHSAKNQAKSNIFEEVARHNSDPQPEIGMPRSSSLKKDSITQKEASKMPQYSPFKFSSRDRFKLKQSLFTETEGYNPSVSSELATLQMASKPDPVDTNHIEEEQFWPIELRESSRMRLNSLENQSRPAKDLPDLDEISFIGYGASADKTSLKNEGFSPRRTHSQCMQQDDVWITDQLQNEINLAGRQIQDNPTSTKVRDSNRMDIETVDPSGNNDISAKAAELRERISQLEAMFSVAVEEVSKVAHKAVQRQNNG